MVTSRRRRGPASGLLAIVVLVSIAVVGHADPKALTSAVDRITTPIAQGLASWATDTMQKTQQDVSSGLKHTSPSPRPSKP